MRGERTPGAHLEGAEAWAIGVVPGGTQLVRHVTLVGPPNLTARVSLHGRHAAHAQLFCGASELEGPGPHPLTARGRRLHVALAYEAPLEEEAIDCGVVFEWEGEREGAWLSGEIQVFTVARVIESPEEARRRGWRTDEVATDGTERAYASWREGEAARWRRGTQQPERVEALEPAAPSDPERPTIHHRAEREREWQPHREMAFGGWGTLAYWDHGRALDVDFWDAEPGAPRARLLLLINHCHVPVELEVEAVAPDGLTLDAPTGTVELEPGAYLPITLSVQREALGPAEGSYVVRRPGTIKASRLRVTGVEAGRGWRRAHLVDPRLRGLGERRETRWYARSPDAASPEPRRDHRAEEQAHVDWELKVALDGAAWQAGQLRMPSLAALGAPAGAALGQALLEDDGDERSPELGAPGPAATPSDDWVAALTRFSAQAAARSFGGLHLDLARAAGHLEPEDEDGAPAGASDLGDVDPRTAREPEAPPTAPLRSDYDDGWSVAPTVIGDFQRIYHHVPFFATNISLGKEYDRDQHDPLHSGYSATSEGHGLIRTRTAGMSMTFQSARQTWIQSETSSIWLGAGASGLNFITGGAQYLSSGRGVVIAAGWGEHGDMQEFGSELAPPIPQVTSISAAMSHVTTAFGVANVLVALAGLTFAAMRMVIAATSKPANAKSNLVNTMWMWLGIPTFCINATKTAFAIHGQVNKFFGLGHDPILPPQTINMVALGGFLAATPAFGSLYGLTGASFRSLNAAAVGLLNASLDSLVSTGMFGLMSAGMTAGQSVTLDSFDSTQIKAAGSKLDMTGAAVNMTAKVGLGFQGTAGVSASAVNVMALVGRWLDARGEQVHVSGDVNTLIAVGETFGVHITPLCILVGTLAGPSVDVSLPHLRVTDVGVELVGAPTSSLTASAAMVRIANGASSSTMVPGAIAEFNVLKMIN